MRANKYADGGWKCKMSINWSLWVAEGHSIALSGANKFFRITLNGKIIGGRISASQKNSGEVTLDITDDCLVSTSVDTANAVKIELKNGISITQYQYYKFNVTIDQYRRLEAIENA